MTNHPIHSHNVDTACKWLCESAGHRTRQDEAEIAKALEALPYRGQALPVGLFQGAA